MALLYRASGSRSLRRGRGGVEEGESSKEGGGLGLRLLKNYPSRESKSLLQPELGRDTI